MYRKYIEDLKKWYKDENKKPLVISGPRFSGKTYLAKTLLGDSILNKQYIYIDCDRDISFLKLINKGITLEELLSYLSINYNIIKLIIFDNVNDNKLILSLIEKLHQYLQTIPIIIIQTFMKYYSNKDMSYMNSFEKICIYPLDFEEYLMVRDKHLYANIKNYLEASKRITKNLKEEIFDLFREYLVIGGLPDVVVNYIETKNYNVAKVIIQKLYQQLINGFGSYYLNVTSAYNAANVFKNIYSSLDQSFFKATGPNGIFRVRDMNIPLKGLAENNILIPVLKTDNLTGNSNKHYKIYMYDLGILNYQNNEIYSKKTIKEAKEVINNSILENYIVIELNKLYQNVKYVKLKNKKDLAFLSKNNGNYLSVSYSNTRSFFSTLSLINEDNKITKAIKLYDKVPSKKIRSHNDVIEKIEVVEVPLYGLSHTLK